MAAYFLDPADFSSGDLTAQGWTKRLWTQRSWTKVSGSPDVFQSSGAEGPAAAVYGLAHGTASPISSGVVQAATHCWHGGDFDSSGLAGVAFIDPTGGNDGNGNGVAIAIQGSTLAVRDAWGNTDIATATLGFSVGNGTKYWLRAEYDFSTQTVSAKAWQGDASDEPSGWQITGADASGYAIAEVVLFARRRASVHSFACFGVGHDEPAPLEPGGGPAPGGLVIPVAMAHYRRRRTA